MPDLRSLLEREMQEIRPADYTIGDVAHRRDRRRRSHRIGTAVFALVISGAAVAGLLRRSVTSDRTYRPSQSPAATAGSRSCPQDPPVLMTVLSR
jgi:hypothetical protein